MRSLLLSLALMTAPLAAASTAQDKAQMVYDGLMNDSDFYVGEGRVTLASFNGDDLQAKSSGRARARGNLVELIRVRVVSKTTDSMSNGSKGSQEEVEAVSSSSSDMVLEGIKYKYLENYPKEGQLTVLAMLSKEDYQQQQERRLLGYKPVHAIRLYGGALVNLAINEAERHRPHNGPTDAGPTYGFGGDVYWNSWFVGAIYATQYRSETIYLKSGYEWTPWATRLQLVFPIQGEVAYNFPAVAAGVAAGMKLRYWASDRVALDVGGLGHYGLTDVEREQLGDYRVHFNTSGFEMIVGVTWNGF